MGWAAAWCRSASMHARGTGLQGGISESHGLPSSAVRPDFAPVIAGREIGGGGESDLTRVREAATTVAPMKKRSRLPQPSSCSSAHLSARIRATLASLITPTAKASPSGCEAGERAAVAGPGAGGGLRDRACRRRRGGRRRSIRSYLLDSAVSRRRASRASTTEVCSSGSACRHRSAA